MPRFYWFRLLRLPVTVHLHTDHRFEWTRIYGLQVGSWFVGAIQGTEARGEG